jgi:hypothetical protein
VKGEEEGGDEKRGGGERGVGVERKRERRTSSGGIGWRKERERGGGRVGKRGFQIIWWVSGWIQRGDDYQWNMA